jgi:diguanylate cyclase (GGDEF)-like protein
MSRAQTLVLALLILNILLGSVCIAVARGDRHSPALRYWGWGMLVYALGLAITQMTFLPRPLSLTVGNSLIAWAPVLSIRGVLSNTPHVLPKRAVAFVLAITIAVLVWNNFIATPSLALVNLLSPSFIAIGLFILGAVWLLRDPPEEARAAARFLAIVMVFTLILWIARNAFVINAIGGTNDRDRVDFVISLFAIGQIVVAVACTMSLFWIEVRKMEAALLKVAFSDALTGLPNRRAMMERFAEESARATRHGKGFALLVLDIDHFKRVNDQHGHLAGDAVLRNVAQLLASNKRAEDGLARIGGEEFVLLLTDPSGDAAATADRLRDCIAQSELVAAGSRLRTTVSGGIAHYPEDGTDWDRLFAAADRRLYASKQAGRDRVTSAG